jgi:protein-tyrosine phosphatase
MEDQPIPIFVDFRLENKTPFIHPDKVVVGIIDNAESPLKHIISDFYQVEKNDKIVFIDSREMWSSDNLRTQMRKLHLRLEQDELFKSKSWSFLDAETVVKLYPNLVAEGSSLPLPPPCKRTISCILPNLYISDMYCAQNYELVSKLCVSAIINVAPDVATNAFESNPNFVYLTLHIQDSAKANIETYFDRTNKFIDKYIKTHGVLVHCAAGISRSATIVIAYVMKALSLPFQEAFTFVQEKHPITEPNFNFLIQLMQHEKKGEEK